jgi:hypothetical protein
MPDHLRVLSREGAITGRVVDAGCGTGEHASGWRGGPAAEPGTIQITGEQGGLHAWLACATRT